ncbi:MAG: AraC family transcriptional regulator [Clostridia bacterium]|nr:AraC family transcriptional regulator [Clostridia bacterium]
MNELHLYEQIPKGPLLMRVRQFENKDYRFFLHWHEHTEIHILLQGEGTLLCNNERIPLASGDCAVINGNELHQGGSGKATYLCLLVPPALLGNRYTVFERVIRDETVKRFAQDILQAVGQANACDMLKAHGSAYLLVAHLLENHTVYALDESLASKHLKKLERINNAVLLMNQNYKNSISTADLASAVYLSEGYFCSLFKEVMGKSAMDYLNGLRVERAEQLLKASDMSVSEIAFCCGFSDANYFSRTYKRFLHKTPSQTRLEKN